MQIDGQQLAAFAAVIEQGSFDAAAARLHVTPSAVSQRIKALEQRVGRVLVVREKPCSATPAGVPLLRLAAQTALLEAEALTDMSGGDGSLPRIALAVNADSMSTWFTGVFAALDDVLFDVRIEDQDHSARLLRAGMVMGAVTTERTPVPGCRAQSLGVMRYVGIGSTEYVARYFPDGFSGQAVEQAPSVAWNRDDALQDMLVRKVFRRPITRRSTMCRRRRGSVPRCAPVTGGACFPRTWLRPPLPTVPSSGSAMRTSTCRCSGNAGSWTARSSNASPMRSDRRPRTWRLLVIIITNKTGHFLPLRPDL